MKRTIILILASLLVLSCATPEQRAARVSIEQEIRQKYTKVTMIRSDSPEWCSYRTNCKYLRDDNCRKRAKTKEQARKICEKRFAINSIKAGGDSFVLQGIKKEFELYSELEEDEYVSGDNDIYLAYGQAYRCTGEFDELGKKYLATRILHPQYRVQFITHENKQRCDPDPKCKFIRTFNCSTVRDKAQTRCIRKIKRTVSRLGINKLVVKDETLDTHKYRVQMDGYQCEIESLL